LGEADFDLSNGISFGGGAAQVSGNTLTE